MQLLGKAAPRKAKTARTFGTDSSWRPYLEALVEICAPLRLKAIDQDATYDITVAKK